MIRLRSVSDNDAAVKLNWLSRKPFSVNLNDSVQEITGKRVKGEFIVLRWDL